MIARMPLLALLALAACVASSDRWERVDDHSLPSSSETSDCHFEARRQAFVRYPDQPASEERGLPRIEDQRRFPAEIQMFEQCMTRKGFVRVSAPAK
jgi:hypothetical protein